MGWKVEPGDFTFEDEPSTEAGDVIFEDLAERLGGLELPPAGEVLKEEGGTFVVEELETFPSLLRRLRDLGDNSDDDLLEPDVAAMLPPGEVARFCLHQGIETDAALRLIRRKESYPALVRGGLLRALWLNFLGYEEGEPETPKVRLGMPVAELHCPPREGCTALYTAGSEKKSGGALRLEFRGLGAGGGLHAKLRFSTGLGVEATCGQVTVPADIEVVPWIRPDDDDRIDVVSVTDVASGSWHLTTIPTGRVHLCAANQPALLAALEEQRRKGWIREGADYFALGSEVPGWIDNNWALEQTRKFSLDFGALVEVRSQFTSEYAYAYHLTGKAAYVAFYEARDSEVRFWAWDPA